MADNRAYQMDELNEKGIKSDSSTSSVTKSSKTRVYLMRALNFVIWTVVLEGIGLGIGVGFPAGDWYDTINKPPITPPDIVFGIVWPILYFMLAIFGCWLTYGFQHTQIKYLFGVFCLQMVGNFFWSPTFQYFHEIAAGLVIIIVLVLLNAYIYVRLLILNIKILSVHTRYLSFFILPYLLWCCFATYLNAYILANN